MERIRPERALIIAGGNPVKRAVVARLEHPSLIIAADSGLDHAYALDMRPDVVIGDMDSVTPEALRRAAAEGIAIERHPVDKDATDLELAINAVAKRGMRRATIIGGTGGRFAHTLANALILTGDNRVHLDWLTSHARITALRTGETERFPADEGPLLSILAVGGASRCSTTGLRWSLDQVSLRPGSTRGISNEITDAAASVTVEDGCVLVVHERNEE